MDADSICYISKFLFLVCPVFINPPTYLDLYYRTGLQEPPIFNSHSYPYLFLLDYRDHLLPAPRISYLLVICEFPTRLGGVPAALTITGQ